MVICFRHTLQGVKGTIALFLVIAVGFHETQIIEALLGGSSRESQVG
jgi:hypothetical protein